MSDTQWTNGEETRLAPLHKHGQQGLDPGSCESGECAQPVTLPSLSALGIATRSDSAEPSDSTKRCLWSTCGRDYGTVDALTTHLAVGHVGGGRSSYACEWQGCERGGRPFAQRQRALRHMQTHTGARPFACSECGKRFSEAHIMQQHQRVHTGEKPFQCSECGKDFAVSSALTIHRRTHTGEKPYKCRYDGCVRRFAESSNLTKHMRIHTGERPFRCPQPACAKAFSRPDQVTRHQRIHSGERPFVCPVDRCDKAFATKSTQSNHVRQVHGVD
ncbi:zinc-finger protein [Coemansia aciculifera]|uniref:Zinc-finger protein n=1 Tax=Coemansia aciculifera TaxID=417176 RepID=A0ACC1LWI0_9FUNG|nr:zinc-finger protein [Coemansia aciculifera]